MTLLIWSKGTALVGRGYWIHCRRCWRRCEGLSEGLSEGLKILLEVIRQTPGIQAKEISVEHERSIKTVERQIKTLMDKKLIERRGSRKTGGYYVVEVKKGDD